ncbi:MATE family efflux transporter [Acinetobacter sp. B5B]|uniref:MATE family efflux transporter n=1 Tax=Acinetobacter baretiae TaxID=2605383 RepID=UPI0018C2FF54|nr:MATE family efflux transporter [Acinetobacter baretiae]MBF7683820.1 MATE family efflux transporter [Acinetobacter baretiae]MBF7686106.1 MATE family efflux transporter [Acinetobacter baretiae]
MAQVASFRTEFKQLLTLMIPILMTQFSQAGLGLIDTIMAGQISAADLAAIAIGVGIWIPIMLLCASIVLATTPLIAEAMGAQKRQNISYIVRQSMWLSAGLGIFAFFILQLMPFMLSVFKVPADLQPKVSLFLRAIAFGMPAVCMYTSLRCYSEALGYPRPVTVISLLSLIVLIPLNYIFMYGIGPIPELGSAGAGFATAILQWLMLFTLAIYIAQSKTYQSDQLFTQWDRFNPIMAKRIMLLGIPIGLAVFFEVSVFSSGAIILSTLGDTIVAAHQIAISVTSQLFMIPMSLSIALTIRVGTYYGAKNWDAMKKVQHVGLVTAAFLSCITMLIIAIFKEHITALYTHDMRVAHITLSLLYFCISYQLLDALQVSAAGCLRGMQDTRSSMWVTLLSYWGISMPLSIYWIRYSGHGPEAIWLSLNIGLLVACVLLLSRLYITNQKITHQTS